MHENRRHRTATAIELRFENRADSGPRRVRLEVRNFRNQQRFSSSRSRFSFVFAETGNHDDVAAPIFGQQPAISKLLLDPLRLCARLVDLVDRNHDRHLGRSRMIDGLQRLRHHAVIGADHQNDDICDLGAPGTHPGKRFVAGSVDENDLFAVMRHLRGADVLGNAAGFAIGHAASSRIASSSDVLPWSTWPMIVTTGGARNLILRFFGQFHFPGRFFFEAERVGRGAELSRQILSHLYIEALVDGREDLAVDQLLDHAGST